MRFSSDSNLETTFCKLCGVRAEETLFTNLSRNQSPLHPVNSLSVAPASRTRFDLVFLLLHLFLCLFRNSISFCKFLCHSFRNVFFRGGASSVIQHPCAVATGALRALVRGREFSCFSRRLQAHTHFKNVILRRTKIQK